MMVTFKGNADAKREEKAIQIPWQLNDQRISALFAGPDSELGGVCAPELHRNPSCGAGSVQIMRRMRSMLENLIQTLPPHRHAELRKRLELLDRMIEVHYSFPDDLAIARIPDSQGLGGVGRASRNRGASG